MLNIQEFKTTFIDYTFDEILVNSNNTIVNSELYLNVKNKYLETTRVNFNNYSLIYNKYQILTNNYHQNTLNNVTSYIYNYVENNEILKNDLKIILKDQRTTYNDFLHFINLL